MSVFNSIVNKSEIYFRQFAEDTDRFLQAVSPAEKALAVCIFGLVLMYFIVLKPKTYKEGGGMGRQFIYAMTIVSLFGFGIGWLFSPDIHWAFRSAPVAS